jgi:hypothetical protein
MKIEFNFPEPQTFEHKMTLIKMAIRIQALRSTGKTAAGCFRTGGVRLLVQMSRNVVKHSIRM